MLQPAAIDIPQPLSADNETVITALETAALFGAKGDALEAVRWLRRAAESAGEAGDDVRALALSRFAAELNEELSAKHILTTPAPPPEPSVLPPEPSVPQPLPVSGRASYPTPPSSRAGHHSTTPPPSSQMPVARSSSGPQATRVAIHRSPSAAGVFEMRVLAEGESALPGDSEAFLVMVDPASTLLSTH
jgi:hypothetical protein